MKKIISIILAILLVTALGVTTVFAAGEGASASVTGATGAPGQTVSVALSLAGFEEADTIGVTVTSSSLNLDTAASSWALSGQLKQIQKYSDKEWRCVWGATSDAADINGKIMSLAFSIPDLEAGDYGFTCAVTVKNGSEVLGTVTASGKVSVVIPATEVTLNTANLKLDLCGSTSATLEATVAPSNTTDTLTWSSSDETVATVENGAVTAKKVGLATVTARAGERSAICVVTVSCSHRGGTATCLEKAVCEVCGEHYGARLAHEFATEWSTDELQHWHICERCGVEKGDLGDHVFDNDTDEACNVCGWSRKVAPDAPTVKVANVASSGKIKLTWGKVEGAAKYKVYRANSKTGTYTLLKTTTGTSLTNTSVEAGKQYYYYVIAVGENGAESEKSSIVTRVCDLPQPVLKAANVATTGKIKLTWDKIDGAKSYKVYRSTSETTGYTLLKTTTGTSLSNTSVEAGTKYYYKVFATHSNSDANSTYSKVVSCTCDLPQPVAKIAVVSDTGKLKLSWEKVEGAKNYSVYRSTDGGETYSLLKTTTGTSLTNTSITAGNKYYYKITANHSNPDANSAYSAVKSGTCDLPRPVVKISVVSSTGKLKLSWEKIEGAKNYSVYRSVDGGETYSLLKTTTGTSLTNTSITAGNKYYYKVKANHTNSAANSAYSAVKSGTCDLPRPVAKVSLNSKGKPVVSWAKIDGAVKYTVYIYDAEGELLKTSSTTGVKLTHSSAVKGTTYKYRVVAVHTNTAANSAKSSTVSITSK